MLLGMINKLTQGSLSLKPMYRGGGEGERGRVGERGLLGVFRLIQHETASHALNEPAVLFLPPHRGHKETLQETPRRQICVRAAESASLT